MDEIMNRCTCQVAIVLQVSRVVTFPEERYDLRCLPPARTIPQPFCSPARYWWTSLTAIAPSPTAEAQRLIEPERTSPAANTPGMLVSSKNGSLERCGQPFSSSTEWFNAVPVRTKPRSSSPTFPLSQPVLASAPIKTNSER